MKHLTKLLTLPGNGVFTVHTAREKKEKLLELTYGTSDADKARTLWERTLASLTAEKPLLLGIPSDNGGGIQRGANWGPLAVRLKLLGTQDSYQDLGDVRVIPHLLHDKYLNEKTIRECRKQLYGTALKLPVSPLSIAETVLEELYGALPEARIFGIGGDHSTSYPLVKAWLKSRRSRKKAALLHFDAHTDLLQSRLGIDLCFGTWTRHILKHLSSTDHIIQIGIRSSGKNKRHWKSVTGVEQYWASEVISWGVEKTYKKVKAQFQKLGIEELYVSFDIDALDAKYAAATGTPEAKGLLPSDCAALLRLLARDFRITGADLMEVAPYVLPEGVEPRDQAASLLVAGDMAHLLLETMQR